MRTVGGGGVAKIQNKLFFFGGGVVGVRLEGVRVDVKVELKIL